ncbi:DUF3592 domain-containing protein [Streptomyces sp. NBC_01244]|uniref:DUF3592 domain-containing protein n=1 Tax=Streptomyces sp. NBC_01244 TaxID=2903797 RepID=UPI002E1130C6|nr:DUF3592 domain-containing protein [Streptomyces sp. NBC_01244]
MEETGLRVPRVAVALPAFAAVLVYGWAHWALTAPHGPSMTVTVSVGALLIAALAGAYFLLVDGNGAFFGAIALALGLLLTSTAVDQATARAETATCTVAEVRTKVQDSFGEGGPGPKTVYQHVLRCPGGYPSELKDDRAAAPVGGEVKVAYDPERRVSPALEGESSLWSAVLLAVFLLAAATLLATSGPAREERRT